jgi:hypothetical protein
LKTKQLIRFVTFILLFEGWANSQSRPEALDPILAKQLQAPEVATFQALEYVMKRAPKIAAPTHSEQWTAEARRLREHLLTDVVFHGWPKEWVTAPPKFENLGVVTGGTGYRMRKLKYEIVPGFYSTAILYEPENLSGKVPAILNVNGHDYPNGKAAEYKQKRCINYARRGMLALSLEWLACGELNQPGNAHSFGAHLDLVGANAVGLFYLAMRRGLDYLYDHMNVDRARLGVTGLSGGGWQTIVLSALDDRVAVAIPVAGFSGLASQLERPNDMGDIEQIPTDLLDGQDLSLFTAMRAPRPTLLINNAEDDCCFRAPLVKPYIFERIRPFFKIFGREDAFEWHENTDPGTHNYQLDNRQQSYRFFTKHFNLPVTEEEMPVDGDIKSYDELMVGLPKDNLTILGLARNLALGITHLPPPSDGSELIAWIAAKRERLRSLIRFKQVAVQHPWAVDNTKNRGIETRSYRFEMSNGLSATGVWVKAIPIPESAPITIVLHDKGKKATSAEVSDRVNHGEQVLALDLIFTGDALPQQFVPQLLATIGERPLGTEVAQLIGVSQWLKETTGAHHVRLESTGMRSQVVALAASAVQGGLFQEIAIREGMVSLKYLLDRPVDQKDAPDLFCFDLYKEFDISQLAVLAEPAKVAENYLAEPLK